MDKEQFYKEFFRYLECGSCADLEFCQKQLEPACRTGVAIYRKLKMEDLEKENEQLKQQLAEKEKEPYLYDEGGDPLSKKDVADLLNRQNNEITKLENELLEKDELLMKKICDMESTDVIKILKRYGFLVQAKEIDNQTAIAELENVKEFIIKNNEPTKKMTNITRFINQKINDLRGE